LPALSIGHALDQIGEPGRPPALEGRQWVNTFTGLWEWKVVEVSCDDHGGLRIGGEDNLVEVLAQVGGLQFALLLAASHRRLGGTVERHTHEAKR
jgi:hypothetical protein